ncbi:hypothetical protein MRB53_011077 [Persea americana]|uniref:Uncharacterized protein n=1 Tax=Persea americana TaxID=3435 RepID=A0ACC2LTR7_PERAE|nr:hypothetical protein MRB53_011077 [Persea americana]
MDSDLIEPPATLNPSPSISLPETQANPISNVHPTQANPISNAPSTQADLRPNAPVSNAPVSKPPSSPRSKLLQNPPGNQNLLKLPTPAALSPLPAVSHSLDGHQLLEEVRKSPNFQVNSGGTFLHGEVPSGTWGLDQLQLLRSHLDSLLKHQDLPPLSRPEPQIQKSYSSFLSQMPISFPPVIPPPTWIDGKLSLKIPSQMVNNSKESFSFSAIGKFVRRWPSLEELENWVQRSWRLSRPCLISLTEKGFFLFRFNSPEDRDILISQSPLMMDKKKLLLQSWSPRQNEESWPAITPVWIRLKGVPYHSWSSDILLSIASSVVPRKLFVELEGDTAVDVEVHYENVPCSECLSVGHLSGKCLFSATKPALLKTSIASLLQPQPAPVTGIDSEPREAQIRQVQNTASQPLSSAHEALSSDGNIPPVPESNFTSEPQLMDPVCKKILI